MPDVQQTVLNMRLFCTEFLLDNNNLLGRQFTVVLLGSAKRRTSAVFGKSFHISAFLDVSRFLEAWKGK
jgi:hypothetical protein